MVKTALLIILLLFAVSGICEFIYLLRMLFFFPGKRFDNYILVELQPSFSIKQLNFIWQKIRWHGNAYACGIIATTDKLSTTEIIRCNSFIKNKSIILCKFNQIEKNNLKTVL